MISIKSLTTIAVLILLTGILYFCFAQVENSIGCYADLKNYQIVIHESNKNKISVKKYLYKTTIRFDKINYPITIYTNAFFLGEKS
jgi:hypothetical protein